MCLSTGGSGPELGRGASCNKRGRFAILGGTWGRSRGAQTGLKAPSERYFLPEVSELTQIENFKKDNFFREIPPLIASVKALIKSLSNNSTTNIVSIKEPVIRELVKISADFGKGCRAFLEELKDGRAGILAPSVVEAINKEASHRIIGIAQRINAAKSVGDLSSLGGDSEFFQIDAGNIDRYVNDVAQQSLQMLVALDPDKGPGGTDEGRLKQASGVLLSTLIQDLPSAILEKGRTISVSDDGLNVKKALDEADVRTEVNLSIGNYGKVYVPAPKLLLDGLATISAVLIEGMKNLGNFGPSQRLHIGMAPSEDSIRIEFGDPKNGTLGSIIEDIFTKRRSKLDRINSERVRCVLELFEHPQILGAAAAMIKAPEAAYQLLVPLSN